MSKINVRAFVSEGMQKVKLYWKEPPKGYYVNYHEILNFCLGQGGNSFISVLIYWTGLGMNIPMMLSYFKVSTGFIFIAGLIGSVLALVRAPILSMIIDNSNSKRGKFKPFLIWTALATVLSYVFIPFIPEAWTVQNLFSFDIPAMPFFGVAASHIDVTVGVLVMFILVQVGTFFNTWLAQCLTGVEQTITPVAQERANINMVRGIIANIPGSVVNILIPALAAAFFATGSVTGMNNIMVYRIFFPICGIGGLILIFFIYLGTEERTVVHKEYVAKVHFRDGAKELTCNKYFWIINIFNIALGIRGNINMYLWICTYGIGGSAGDTALALCNMFLNNALVPGMLLAPFLIKRFGKRNVMIFSTVGFTAMAFLQLVTIRSPYLMLVGIFFQNLLGGIGGFANLMVSDVLDYQQWKSGHRLEGFWQNYSAIIGTVVGFFTSALMPLFMSFGGVGFGDSIDVALKDPTIMQNTFRSVTWLGIIGALICMVPMLFYDLTEAKHANYIRALKIRAAVKNYQNGELGEEELQELKTIADEATEKEDAFILDELKQHDCIKKILSFENSESVNMK